ncbi:unnamed protein product [Protopolystoma xenopodis]|uniref:EXS domain-containing protein n=1 Tax=Protopolystoma xenopodis TaxID=117903 RepID=A0A448XN24_9PLAT|nr:unnamed protein product [Protopolystoma xenopodis]
MDWGLMDCEAKESKLLRDELVYRFRAYYYLAIIEDFLIRMAWIPILTLQRLNSQHLDLIRTILAVAEVIRYIN